MSYTFLIIDDDRACRNMLIQIIESEQFGRVIGAAENGIEAEQIIIKQKPDIILIDLLMPGIDGVELTQKIKDAGLTAA